MIGDYVSEGQEDVNLNRFHPDRQGPYYKELQDEIRHYVREFFNRHIGPSLNGLESQALDQKDKQDQRIYLLENQVRELADKITQLQEYITRRSQTDVRFESLAIDAIRKTPELIQPSPEIPPEVPQREAEDDIPF
jgi:hypothetical protein